MSRSAMRIAVCVLVISLSLAGVVSADDTSTWKRQYIKDAVHVAFIAPGGYLDASDGADADGTVEPWSGTTTKTEVDGVLHNVQVNDPALDNIQTFTGTRPFEFSIQSETSVATFGKNVVVGYNSSANQPVVRIGTGLFFTHRFLSGYSSSKDGGKTWTSGFVPPNAGSPFTFGDPSLTVDRAGNFYYASLGTTAGGANGALIVNKSADGGATFAPAVVAAIDNGSDKEWLTAGRDPKNKKQDNLYLTWTSFATDGSGADLRFVKSTDGGATWSAQRTLFAPVDDGVMSSFVQFSNPVVDASNGRLYVPFLHFSDLDSDFVKVLISDDAGATFKFLEFNVPGAPDKYGFPVVTPGTLTDCGRNSGGIRLILHQGADLGGGRFGLPRYRQATRLVTQPAAAVVNGRLWLAMNASDSPFFGDPTATSSIRVLYSPNGGKTWSVSTAVRSTTADPQHVHPAIAVDQDGEQASLVYYTQQADGKVRVDEARGQAEGNTVRWGASTHVSTVAADLPPTNNPMPIAGNSKFTTNYDRTIRPCYAIGEYLSVTLTEDGLLAAWGDLRNSWTAPTWTPPSPVRGTHSQPDVFFQRLQD